MFDIVNFIIYAIENMELGIPVVECNGSTHKGNENGYLMH